MKWIDLVPSEFARLVREGAPCVVPMGSLERHGEHIPFGCDLIVTETVAERAAKLASCVVFPGYYLAQVHEAACFLGTVNLPQALAVETLSKALDSIAANGFKKIVILNGHGGNNAFLNYFSMSRMDEAREYVLYIVHVFEFLDGLDDMWEIKPTGHACEMETSVFMACRPGLARLDLARGEPVQPLKRFEELRRSGVSNAHGWYADYPQHVVGSPAKATEEKGRKALDVMVSSTAKALETIRNDTVAPALQKEFLSRVQSKGK